MNSLKSLFAAKTLAAAALAAAGMAVPAIGHASADDGVQCRPNYTGSLNGARFVCSRDRLPVLVDVSCPNTRFPTYVIRAPGATGDTSGGRDICVAANRSIGTTDALTGLVVGQDFIFATTPQAVIDARVAQARQAEATALNVPLAAVDVRVLNVSTVPNLGVGSQDKTRVSMRLFTMPVAVLGLGDLTPVTPPNLPSGPILP